MDGSLHGYSVTEKLTGNLFRSEFSKVVDLSLVWCPTSVPEEKPLKRLIAFELILEAELVIFVGKFEEIKEFGTGFHDCERRGLGVVDQDGDAS